MTTQHTFADGKYTVINDNGNLTALRHGEPWTRDFTGDNLVYWMLVEVERLKAALAALAAKDEPVAIKWEKDADKECHYNNWVGITPFGKILITWKGWKEYHDACVDEFPGGFEAYGLPDDVKAACEVEYLRRLYTTPPQRTWVGLTEQEHGAIMEDLNAHGTRLYEFAAAIEAKLKEKNT
jgi:hypothetical protein